MPTLPELPEPRATWPKLSVIIPACNEAETLRAATLSKLETDYPELELVLVDDRSTDGTSEIVDELAALDPRVRAVHVRELPEGWLGKVHALDFGAKAATGEFILFSDADVHMDRGLLRRSVDVMLREEHDFIALFPKVWSNGLGIDMTMAVFIRVLISFGRMWMMRDPKSHLAMGSGVFNMVRKNVFQKTEGFSWLRMEILDDVGLAQMVKRAGARCALYQARESLCLHYYASLGEMMRGMEKNGYSAFGQLRLGRALGLLGFLVLGEISPVAIAVLPQTPLVARMVAVCMISLIVIVQAGIARWGRRPVVPALIPIVGGLICFSFMARSVLLIESRGAVTWRGTRYGLRELRAGVRATF